MRYVKKQMVCFNNRMFPKMKLPNKNLLKIKWVKIRVPKIKWPLRILLYVMTLILSVLSILIQDIISFNTVIAYTIYVLAACGIGLSGCYMYNDLKYGVNKKLKPAIESNYFTSRVAKDYRYRTVLSTYSSLSANLIFAFGNGVFGIINHSVWFGSLSAYYIILSIMRFIVIQYERRISTLEKTQKMRLQELSVYQNCGLLFILLTIALGASVIQMVYFDKGHSYSGTLIFAVAVYTFYKIVLAIINVVKAGRLKSPLLQTIRYIGYADAVVSMLSLQTAMFVSFGSDDRMNKGMNSLTGGMACLMILSIGFYMICSAKVKANKIT